MNTQSKNKDHHKLHFCHLISPPVFPSSYQSPPNKTFTMNTSLQPPFSPPLTTKKYNNALLVVDLEASKYVHHTKNHPNNSRDISQTALANHIIYWLTSKSHMKYLLLLILLKDPFEYSFLRRSDIEAFTSSTDSFGVNETE